MIASGRTGFTLPGMIDEPAWSGWRRISPVKLRRRRSPAILMRFTACALRIPDTSTKGSAFAVSPVRFSPG